MPKLKMSAKSGEIVLCNVKRKRKNVKSYLNFPGLILESLVSGKKIVDIINVIARLNFIKFFGHSP